MKTLLRTLNLAMGCFLTVALFNGCTTYVPLCYVPQTGVNPVTGAGTIAVRVEVTDARTTEKNNIGSLMSTGTETISILTTNDVAGFLKNVIETELTNRGFNLSGSNVLVTAEVRAFDSYFDVPYGVILGGTAAGHVTMNVQVKRADGNRVYERVVAGEYHGENVSYSGANRARFGLDMALQDAMAKLFGDRTFIDSLLQTAKPSN